MKKLANGCVDLWVAVGVTAYYLVRTHLPDRLHDLTFISKPLGSGSVDISFLKVHKDAKKMKALYEKGLENVRKNGICKKILKRYFGEGMGEGMMLENSLPSCS
jgi:ABC-type amino acid transport substrate-binding protein